MERFFDDGDIHKIINTDGVMKFVSCQSCSSEHSYNHIHFSCQKCKTVNCLEDVEPTYELPESYKVSEMHFTLSGLCPK